MDKGIKEVRDWVGNIVGEVVKKYEVDGIKLDDYLYREKKDQKIEERKKFDRYGKRLKRKEEWRR